MTQQNFQMWSALTNALTSPVTGVTVGTTTKTVQQIVAPANMMMAVKEWGYTILGSTLPTTPIQLELLTTGTTFATVTPGNIGNFSNPGGSSSQTQTGTVQVVSLGTPTAGTFTLTFNGATSSSIAYNATASTVQTAVQAMSSVGSGNATVTGSTGGPYTITFAGALLTGALPPVSITSSLTGGTPVVSSTQSGYNATAEGTITASRLIAMRNYPVDWSAQYPLSDEAGVSPGHALRVRATSPGGNINIATYVRWVEAA